MEHIAGNLDKIEQNMKLNTADPIARYGFTQLPNFILRNPDLSANAPKDRIPLAVRHIHSFLKAHRPG